MPHHEDSTPGTTTSSFDGIIVKASPSIGRSIGSAARQGADSTWRRKPKVVPFDADPDDADSDNLVQENTIHERLKLDLPEGLEDLEAVLKPDEIPEFTRLLEYHRGLATPMDNQRGTRHPAGVSALRTRALRAATSISVPDENARFPERARFIAQFARAVAIAERANNAQRVPDGPDAPSTVDLSTLTTAPEDLRAIIADFTPERVAKFEARRQFSRTFYRDNLGTRRETARAIEEQAEYLREFIANLPDDEERRNELLADLAAMIDIQNEFPERDHAESDRIQAMSIAELAQALQDDTISEDGRVEAAEALADAIYGAKGVDKDGQKWHSEVTSASLYGEHLTVSGVIYGEGGTRHGSFSRDLNLETGRVSHSVFEMEADSQKKGIGGAFVKFSMHQAREAGFQYVHLHAVNDVDWNGFRTWPKLGFEVVGHPWTEAYDDSEYALVEELQDRIGMSIEDMTAADIIKFNDEIGEANLHANMELDLDDLPDDPPPHVESRYGKVARLDGAARTWDDWDRILDDWRFATPTDSTRRERTEHLGRTRTVKTPSRLATKGKPPIPVTYPGDMNPHFVCPPGTPRGGQWTDRLGTDCLLPEPEKLGRTIGDLANGPDKPGRDVVPDVTPDAPTPSSTRTSLAPKLVAENEDALLDFFTSPSSEDRERRPIRLPSGARAPEDPKEAADAFRAELRAILDGPMEAKLPILQRHADGSLKLPDIEFDPEYDPSWDVNVGKTPALLITESLAHDLYDMEGESKTGAKWTSRVGKVTVTDNSAYITGVIYDENGKSIGEFTRQFYIKRGVAYHTVFQMDRDQQKSGIGGAFVKESMHQARDAGFKQVDLHAVITPKPDPDDEDGTHYNGLVVWPHLGFHLTSEVSFDDEWMRDDVLAQLGLDHESQIDESHLILYPEVFDEVYADANMSLNLEDLPADRPPHARAVNRKAARAAISWDDWDKWLDQLNDPYVDKKQADRQRRARRRTESLGRTVPEAKGLPRIGASLTGRADLPGGKKKPKVVPFDPDPIDADHDNIGQENTIHERLLTPDLDPIKDLAAILRGPSAGKLAALKRLTGSRQNPQTDEQVAAARRIAGSLGRDIYAMRGVDKNGRAWEARVTNVEVATHGHQITVSGMFYAPINVDDDPDFDPEDPSWWEPIGKFSRTLYPSMDVAMHDVINIQEQERGTGMGTTHVMESMHRAREAGIGRVELQAITQPKKPGGAPWNGVTTWANLGFEVVPGSAYFTRDKDEAKALETLGLSSSDEITADHIRQHPELFKDVDVSADMSLDLSELPAGRPPNVAGPGSKAAPSQRTVSWEDWQRLLDEYFATMSTDYPDNLQLGRGRRVQRKVFAAFVATKVSRQPIPVTYPGDMNPHFVCPPGTPRGGQWTDRLGTDCLLPEPEKLGRTIGDIADGPDKPLGDLRTSNTSESRRVAADAARLAATPVTERRQRSAEALIERIRTELPRAEADLADRRERYDTAVAAGDDDSTIAELDRAVAEAAAEVADYRRMLGMGEEPPPGGPPQNEPPAPDGKPPRFSRDTIMDLVTKVRENEGFTVNANNAEDQVSGYAVGIGTGEYSGVIDAAPFMTDDEFAIAEVEKWLEQHEDLLASDQVDHIGAWYDTEEGKVILDPVQVVPDDGPYSPNPTEAWRARAEDQALELCRARNQRSMFHLDTFRTVWCGGTGGYADEATGRAEPIRLPMTLPDRIETTDQFFPADRFGPGGVAGGQDRAEAIDGFETRLKQVWYRWDGARAIRQAAWDIMGAEPTGIDPQIGRSQTMPDPPWVKNPVGWRDQLADGGAEYFARYILSRMLDEDHGGHDRGELYRGIRLSPEETLAMFGDAERGIPGVVEEGKTFDMPPMSFAERMSVGVVDLTEFYGTDTLLVVKGNPRALRLMPMVGPLYDESDEESYLDYFLDPDNMEYLWRETGRADTYDSPEELQAAIDQTIAEIEAAYEAYKQSTYKELDFVEGQKRGAALGELIVAAGEMRERVMLAGMPRDDGYYDYGNEEEQLPHEVLTGGRFYVRSIYPDPRGRYGRIVEVEQVGVIDPATGKMVDTTDISKHVKGFATWLIDLL